MNNSEGKPGRRSLRKAKWRRFNEDPGVRILTIAIFLTATLLAISLIFAPH